MTKNLIVLILWTLVLLGLTLAPIGGVEKYQFGGFSHWDKVAHLILFGITGFIYAWGASYFKTITVRALFGLVLALALALITEELQHFVARNPSFCDLLADMAGLSLGLLLYILLEIRRQPHYPMD
jgi:VanZ family protein